MLLLFCGSLRCVVAVVLEAFEVEVFEVEAFEVEHVELQLFEVELLQLDFVFLFLKRIDVMLSPFVQRFTSMHFD